MECMRGESIEPASLTWVAREVKLRRGLAVNKLRGGRSWVLRSELDVDVDVDVNRQVVEKRMDL